MKAPQIDFSRLAQFQYAIISLVEQDGYPYSIPTEFHITARKQILLKHPEHSALVSGRRVGVLFNHITAIPTGGYTDRRYILIWGSLSENDGMLELHPETMSGWDEKVLPFPELCARAAPQGQKYLAGLSSHVEA